MKKLTTATAALLFSATTALGGTLTYVDPEPVVYTPTPAPAFNWTGGYVGLFGGMVHGSNYWETPAGSESDPDDWSGTPWGLMLGYNMQRNGMVFGGEFDITGRTISAASTTSATFGCNVGGECFTDVDRLMSLRARVGVAQDRTMFYGTAGVAFGRVTGTSIDGAGDTVVHGQENRTGWAAGIGLEHAVNDRFTVRGEYIHTNLGSTALPDDCGVDCFTDVSFGVIRLGGAFRF
ncbi:MAG: porin family protein [Pararhodobacter sp.]|nr:porin family protein [Pararhodobacter sp.]